MTSEELRLTDADGSRRLDAAIAGEPEAPRVRLAGRYELPA